MVWKRSRTAVRTERIASASDASAIMMWTSAPRASISINCRSVLAISGGVSVLRRSSFHCDFSGNDFCLVRMSRALHVWARCRATANPKILLTERGATFGYNNLVVDMRSLPIMRKFAPVVFDATHSVQLPSASGEKGNAASGGQPEFIPVLARAAVAAGVDGIFLEVHDNPKEAKSDGANALDLKLLRGVLAQLLAIHKAVQ